MSQLTDYEQRLAAALAELTSKGVSNRVAQPPYFRLARRFDLQVKPPYYASFGFNAVFACIVFTVFWGVIMWILVGSKTEMSISNLATDSLKGGLIVGLITAVFCHLASRYHQLTPWDALLINKAQKADNSQR